jgi:hypothetical protein
VSLEIAADTMFGDTSRPQPTGVYEPVPVNPLPETFPDVE